MLVHVKVLTWQDTQTTPQSTFQNMLSTLKIRKLVSRLFVKFILLACFVFSDEGLRELSGDAASGQFWSEDTYVVRWKYKVSLTGRTLKGGQSKHVAVGR